MGARSGRGGLAGQAEAETINRMRGAALPRHVTCPQVRAGDYGLDDWYLNPEAADIFEEAARRWGGKLGRTSCAERRCVWEWRPWQVEVRQISLTLPCPHSEGVWPDDTIIEADGLRYVNMPGIVAVPTEKTDGRFDELHLCCDVYCDFAAAAGATEPLPIVGEGELGTVGQVADLADEELEGRRMRRRMRRPTQSKHYRSVMRRAAEIAAELETEGHAGIRDVIRRMVEEAPDDWGWGDGVRVAVEWWHRQAGIRTDQPEGAAELLGW